jgi:hypothetical protein
MNAPLAAVPDTTDTVSLADLVVELTDVTARLDALTERRDILKAQLLDIIDVGTIEIAGVKVTVTAPERFDGPAFARDWPAATFPQLYKAPAPDTRKARAFIDITEGVDLDTYTNQGAKQLRLS